MILSTQERPLGASRFRITPGFGYNPERVVGPAVVVPTCALRPLVAVRIERGGFCLWPVGRALRIPRLAPGGTMSTVVQATMLAQVVRPVIPDAEKQIN